MSIAARGCARDDAAIGTRDERILLDWNGNAAQERKRGQYGQGQTAKHRAGLHDPHYNRPALGSSLPSWLTAYDGPVERCPKHLARLDEAAREPEKR